MRPMLAMLLLGLSMCAAASAQPSRAEKLTPAESTWVNPVLKLWTNMNKGLGEVVQQATASNALIAGSPNNGKLIATLAGFVECASSLKKAGAPPTVRLKQFDATVGSMCAHLATGANDLAKGIAAVGKNNAALAKKEITAGYAEFVSATTDLKKAGTQIVTLGGKNIFTA